MNNKKMLFIMVAFFIGISGIVYSMRSNQNNSGIKVNCEDNTKSVDKQTNADVINKDAVQKHTDDSSEKEDGHIYVYVCGNVKNPGVYKLDSGKRIADAIAMAGGVTKDAKEELLNQAQKISDGDKIYVPGKDDNDFNDDILTSTGVSDSSYDGQESDGKVNINTASEQELMTISGIGQARAKAIIEYREKEGVFKSIEDIKNVSGIKDGLYERIYKFIKV